MTTTQTANSTDASPTARDDVFNNVGKRETFTAEQKEQRDRDGLAYISKQFVRYGLTSVHHEGGDLFALQQVRARGELLHRVSYEASGRRAGGDDQRTASAPASATSGFASAPPRSTPPMARSPSARWR